MYNLYNTVVSEMILLTNLEEIYDILILSNWDPLDLVLILNEYDEVVEITYNEITDKLETYVKYDEFPDVGLCI